MEKKNSREVIETKKTKLITIEYDEYKKLEEYGNIVRTLVGNSEIKETTDPKNDNKLVSIRFPKKVFLETIGLNVPARLEDITVEVK